MTRRQEVEHEIRDIDAVEAALDWAGRMARKGLQRGPVVLRLGRPRRTLDQNRKLWPMCADVSRQVEWHGQRLSKEDWKDLFVGSALLRHYGLDLLPLLTGRQK